MQNSLYRVVTRSSKFSHITPQLKKLHWLPVRYRVQFKIGLITYKILNQGQPVYLMWVFHHTTNAPDKGFWGVGLKYLLSPRPSVRIGCCLLGPCEKSNMFDISHDYNRFIFPAVNKISSPRRPQASSDPNLHSRVLSQAACDP